MAIPKHYSLPTSLVVPGLTSVLRPFQPVVICPYVFDEDKQQVIQAFGLEQPGMHPPPFFFWKDEKLIGPERAYEHCWNQFPDHDVIILHTDMRPIPQDSNNAWYAELCAKAKQLPYAGIIACDLLFPLKSPKGNWYVQCAGGYIKSGQIGHIGGGVQLAEGIASVSAYEYDGRFSKVRRVDWVTFGGVYIRRETINRVGGFDQRYEWAYVMDVDYCLEAHIRGLKIYQVPINLLHEESKTSMKFLEYPEYRAKKEANLTKFYQKWAWLLAKGNIGFDTKLIFCSNSGYKSINSSEDKPMTIEHVHRFWGSEAPICTQIGERIGRNMVSTQQEGYLIYGPYLSLPKGTYRVVIRGELGAQGIDGTYAEVVYDAGNHILAKSAVNDRPGEDDCLAIYIITLEKSCADLEVRVWVTAYSEMKISLVEIYPCTGSGDETLVPPIFEGPMVAVRFNKVDDGVLIGELNFIGPEPEVSMELWIDAISLGIISIPVDNNRNHLYSFEKKIPVTFLDGASHDFALTFPSSREILASGAYYVSASGLMNV